GGASATAVLTRVQFDNWATQTQNVAYWTDFGTVGHGHVEGCYLAGAGYCIYIINSRGNFLTGPFEVVDTRVRRWGVNLYRGTWDSATAYASGDIVDFGNPDVEYVALQAGTNHQPDTAPTFWSANVPGWGYSPAKWGGMIGKNSTNTTAISNINTGSSGATVSFGSPDLNRYWEPNGTQP